MRTRDLLVDGRTLDDRHPGVRRYWVPVLRAWAARGGRGLVAHGPGQAPEPALLDAGFVPLELPRQARHPLGLRAARPIVRASGVRATLSPLYLTLDGAPRNLACVFDLTGREHARSLAARGVWEIAMRRIRRRASQVLVPSQATGKALAESVPGLEGRLALVSPVTPPPPVADPAVLAELGIAPPYALALASHRPHKQLAELARAWGARGSTVPLVVAGIDTQELDLPPAVRALGFVSDAQRDALLASAACVVSASQAEGFGLPLLEALAAGVPIVATRLPAYEEVAGEAAFWVDAGAVDALVERALTLADRSEDAVVRVEAGRARAATFSADRAAEELQRTLRA